MQVFSESTGYFTSEVTMLPSYHLILWILHTYEYVLALTRWLHVRTTHDEVSHQRASVPHVHVQFWHSQHIHSITGYSSTCTTRRWQAHLSLQIIVSARRSTQQKLGATTTLPTVDPWSWQTDNCHYWLECLATSHKHSIRPFDC